MKLKLLSFFTFVFITTTSTAQIDGHHCGFDHLHNKMISEDANLEQSEDVLNSFIKNYIAANKDDINKKSAITYTIPVAFHIIHDDGPENISHEQIVSAIDRLNECFNGSNAELSTIQSDFTSIIGVANVEFKLATLAPNGACFRGVTRTKSSTTFDNNESAQLNAVKNENDVYQGEWPSDMYLNIFVADVISSPGAAAYAYFPSSNSMSRGVWSQHRYIGSVGTSNPTRSGTVVHELGHWFSLYHPWGSKNLVGSNNPSPSDCGVEDDQVQDTPETIGNKSCDLDANTCDDDNAYWGYDIIDNVENFMEYSYCFKMFTQGQSDRMIAALQSPTGGRNNLWKSTNLIATGTDAPATLCSADFNYSETVICTGETIFFTDASYSNQNEWTWTFNGGTINGSNKEENPSVTYNTAGSFSVSLEVSDGASSVSTTKSNLITVLPNPGTPAAFKESFEDLTTLPNDSWRITDEFSSDFNVSSEASVTGVNSLRITNSANRDGNVYELISNTIDMTSVIQPTISFKLAFAKRDDVNKDKLEIYASNDCGRNFERVKFYASSNIVTSPVNDGKFVPNDDEWKTFVIDDIPLEYIVSNAIFKFVFYSDGGNHLFLEDINIGDISLLSYNENLINNTRIDLFPNPSNSGSINLRARLIENSSLTVDIYDLVGKKILSNYLGEFNIGNVNQTINTQNLIAGSYIFNISINGVVTKSENIVIQ